MSETRRRRLATARDALKRNLTDDQRALARALSLVELATFLEAEGEIAGYCRHALAALASIKERTASVRAARGALKRIVETARRSNLGAGEVRKL